MGLGAKLHCAAGELSGGQRRKLSVAIAFLGDPAVVFLVGRPSVSGLGAEHCVLLGTSQEGRRVGGEARERRTRRWAGLSAATVL